MAHTKKLQCSMFSLGGFLAASLLLGCAAAAITISVYTASRATGADRSAPNGGSVRQPIGLISLVLCAAFGVLGVSLLSNSSSAESSSRCDCSCSISKGCGYLWRPSKGSLFIYLNPYTHHREFQRDLPLSLLLQAIGLFWLCSSIVLVFYSLAWLQPAYRSQSAEERHWDIAVYGYSPNQLLFYGFPWVLHTAEAVGLRRDANEAKVGKCVLEQAGCCVGLDVRKNCFLRIFTPWYLPALFALLFRALRVVTVRWQHEAAGPVGDALPLFSGIVLVALIVTRIVTFKSTLLTTALSKLAGLTYLAGTVLCLIGLLALPADDGLSTMMFITGTYYGYFVPIHLWVLVLQTQAAENNAMGMFVRYLSHEIRVPANVSLLALGEAQAAIRSVTRRNEWQRRADAASDKGPLVSGVVPGKAPVLSQMVASPGATFPNSDGAAELGCKTVHTASNLQPVTTQLPTLRHTSGTIDPVVAVLAVVKPAEETAGGGTARLRDGANPDLQPKYQNAKLAVKSRHDADFEDLGVAEENTKDALLALQGMKQLLDRTLDLARFESGMQSLDEQVFHMGRFLGGLYRESLLGFKAAGVKLVWRPHGTGALTVHHAPQHDELLPRQSLPSDPTEVNQHPFVVQMDSPVPIGPAAPLPLVPLHCAESPGLWVRGDPLRLRQSIMNILHNASKYTPRGSDVFVDIQLLEGGGVFSARGASGGASRRRFAWCGACCCSTKRTQRTGLPTQLQSAPHSPAVGSADDSSLGGGSPSRSLPLPHAPHTTSVGETGTGVCTVQNIPTECMLVVAVRDTGRGMTPAEQRGIFTPFSRLHSAQEGTGLGLNIARKAMRTHGGDVEVRSEGLGKGCTFTVSAVLQHSSPPSRHSTGSSNLGLGSTRRQVQMHQTNSVGSEGWTPMGTHTGGAASSIGSGTVGEVEWQTGTLSVLGTEARALVGGICVLVVDDDAATRKVLSRILKRHCAPGTCVLTAADGKAAVDLIEAASKPGAFESGLVLPTHITMDNQMPVMTGVVATRELRAAGYDGRIVGVSGNATRVGNDEDGFLAAGADAVLSKPVSFEKLQEALMLSP